MVRALLAVAFAVISLSACTRFNGVSQQAKSTSATGSQSPVVGSNQADPSPLVKIEAFGYRRGGVRTGFIPVLIPQIPQGSDLLIRGRLTAAALQSDMGTARVSVNGTGRVSNESLTKGPSVELVVPASNLKLGVFAAAVEMVTKRGTVRSVWKPIAFEVDSAPARIPHQVTKSAVALRGGIDIIDSLTDQPPTRAANLVLKRGDALLVEGWAYDPTAHSRGSALLIVVDGKATFQAEYGIPRPDVVQHYNDETYRNVGFAAIVRASAFSAGSHQLDLMVLTKDGRHYYSLPTSSSFSVE